VPRDQFVTAMQTQQNSPAFRWPSLEKRNISPFGNLSLRHGPRVRWRMLIGCSKGTQIDVKSVLIILLVDDVTDRREGELQNESVYPTDVFAQKNRGSEIFNPMH